jgi:hypothetical protein
LRKGKSPFLKKTCMKPTVPIAVSAVIIAFSAALFPHSLNAQEVQYSGRDAASSSPTSLIEKITTPIKEKINTLPKPVELSEENLLILEVHLGRYIINPGLIGYLHSGGVLLPLNEVMQTLDFAVTSNPAAGQADGWFLRENRRFSLDIGLGKVVVQGKTTKFDPRLVFQQIDDLYVDTTLLSKWFPVDLEFDLAQLVIKVKSREPLPLEERLDREKRAAFLGIERVLPEYPRQEIPYRLIDWPFIDTSYTLNYNNQTEKFVGSRTSLMSGDLLFMTSELFLAGTNEEATTDLRFKMSRKDPDGNLLGPLRAQEIAVGDIFTPQLPLIADGNAGRGFEISSFPLVRASEFDRTTLRGELPLGWQVELYRNEILLQNQVGPDASGRYEFIDVPLLFGNNVLKLIFYGPQGQRREEVQRFNAGRDLTRPGEQYFRVAANQKSRDLLLVGGEEIRGQDGKERYFAGYERGITRRLSVAANISSLPFEDARRNYLSLGLRSALFGTFSRLDVTRNDQGETAFQVTSQASLSDINIFAEHGQFFNFVSERFSSQTDPLETRSSIRIDGLIPASLLPRIPYSFSGELERRESGRNIYDLSNRLSIFTRGVSFSNNISATLGRGGDLPDTTTADGSLLLSGRIFTRLSLRGTADYSIEPKKELTSAAVTGDYNFTSDFSTRLTVTHSFRAETTNIAAGLNRRFQKFDLGINAAYTDDGTYSGGINISFGIGKDPRQKRIHTQSRRMATTGAASARVFLDKNMNGKFDDQDEPLKDVTFRGQRNAQTDEDGTAMITSLSAHRPSNVVVDPGSLEDPFWVLPREGVELIPRPGRSALLEFPVVPTGEIDGTVWLVSGNIEKEVSNVELQLVDAKGAVAKETKTTFDGFYLFESVMPGRYTLRVSSDQVKRLNLIPPPEQEVEIDMTGNVVSGVNITLERAPKKPKPSTAPKTNP